MLLLFLSLATVRLCLLTFSFVTTDTIKLWTLCCKKYNLYMTCFLYPECPRLGSGGKCYFWETGKMYFACLLYKGKESITTRMRKVRPGSFVSSCRQEGQHTKSLEKIKQAGINLWSRRQKSYAECRADMKGTKLFPFNVDLRLSILTQTRKSGSRGGVRWVECGLFF